MSILGGTTACSDFLEENPKSEISSSQYFTQPDHARAAVNKLYRSGVPQFYDADAYAGSKMMYGGYMSGFFDNEKKATGRNGTLLPVSFLYFAKFVRSNRKIAG